MHSNSEALLELNQNRTIVFEDRGKTYTLVCRRVTPRDWERYFSGIVVTSQQQGRERINVVDVNTPRLALAEAVLVDAQGYRVAGDVPLTSMPNWQSRLPLSHRLQLGETLADVRPSQSESEFVIHPEGEEILLDATWSHSGSGMQQYRGLRHVLKTPTEAQHRRYSDEASRSRVVGGSRSAKTFYRGAQLLLAKLYDELVICVEGYCIDSRPLGTPDEIVREMDMLHKVMAAQEIFQPQSTVSLAEASEATE